MEIKDNVTKIQEEIAQLKQRYQLPYDITICAATKYVGTNEMKELLTFGIAHFGENRVNDFLDKYEILKNEPITWHFIGSLQTNKVKKVINKIDYLHSLDRESLAQEINKHRNEVLNCFVEVNCSNESSKHGLNPHQVRDFILSLNKYDKIRIIGLMTMAENTNDEKVLRETFRKLKSIQLEIKNLHLPYAPCTELSMGMSNDYVIAIEEGATIVRIGSKLFK